jgi:hypothetical protein
MSLHQAPRRGRMRVQCLFGVGDPFLLTYISMRKADSNETDLFQQNAGYF